MELGDRLKHLRLQANLKQSDLGEAIGISASNISRIEKNEISPSSNILLQICNFFNVSTDWLLTGKGDIYKQNEEVSNIPKDKVIFNVLGYGDGITKREISKENWEKAWALMDALEEIERKRRNDF